MFRRLIASTKVLNQNPNQNLKPNVIALRGTRTLMPSALVPKTSMSTNSIRRAFVTSIRFIIEE